MFSGFQRKRNIRIALSRQEPFERRNHAIYELGNPPATPEAINALAEIAQSNDELNVCQSAIGRLASLSDPDSLRVLLKLIISESNSNSWIFIEAIRGLSWNTITLNKIAAEALPPLLQAGRNVLGWKRSTAGERSAQASFLSQVREIIENLQTSAGSSALDELDKQLRDRRTAELPGLLKTALESKVFEEAESALAEIAGLETDEAHAALVKIRQQALRQLIHTYEKDDETVETGYSPKRVSVSRSSSELGETLKGPGLARWEAART
jgi:hypothetical protein